MEFFPPGLDIDWMKRKTLWFSLTCGLSLCGLVGMFWPGPNWGTDFEGGTEIQISFSKQVDIGKLRSTIASLGHGPPEIVKVGGSSRRYIIRVAAVSPIKPQRAKAAAKRVKQTLQPVRVDAFRLSPGGDKLSLQLSDSVEVGRIEEAVRAAGLDVRSANAFGKPDEHRYEVYLVGIGDAIMKELRERLGPTIVPDVADRVDWVGPRAGAQLRNAGIKSLCIALLLIGIYIAFRFDLRFAPGALVSIVHDVSFSLLAMLILRAEVTLTTIAAVLTIAGYSINDTIIIYDRIRENLTKMRDVDLQRMINVSINETLGRTVNTVLTAELSVLAIIIFTTGNVREFAITLFFGFGAGVYSTVFIASPITIWLDKYLFRRQSA